MYMQKTFQEVSEIWCNEKRKIVKHSTMCAYMLTLQTHLLPRFGSMTAITGKRCSMVCHREVFLLSRQEDG